MPSALQDQMDISMLHDPFFLKKKFSQDQASNKTMAHYSLVGVYIYFVFS